MKSNNIWSCIPTGYFMSEYEKADSRRTELDAEFKIVFANNMGRKILNNSFFLTEDEQKLLDAERETMIFGFEGGLVKILLRFISYKSEDEINNTLDRVEAKCFYRDILGFSDPIPPRLYENNYLNYWQDFFQLNS